MKIVIQRVKEAKVEVEEKIVGSVGEGYMILVGVGQNDTKSDADVLADKTVFLRIFEDENGKMNKSIQDIDGEILSVSQFTLYADCKHGRRPSFTHAGAPDEANKLYEYFNSKLLELGIRKVETGVFGADMKVSLLNDGPVTIILDSKDLL